MNEKEILKEEIERIKKINEMIMFELHPQIIYLGGEEMVRRVGSKYGYTILNEKGVSIFLNREMGDIEKEIVLNHEMCHVLLNHWDRHILSEGNPEEKNDLCCYRKIEKFCECEANDYFLTEGLIKYIDGMMKEDMRKEFQNNTEEAKKILETLKVLGMTPEEYIEKYCAPITYEKLGIPHYSAEILYELIQKEEGDRKGENNEKNSGGCGEINVEGDRKGENNKGDEGGGGENNKGDEGGGGGGENNGGCGGIKIEGDVGKIKDWLKTKGKLVFEKLKKNGLLKEGEEGEKSKGEGVGERGRYKVEEKEKYSSQIIEKVMSTEIKWGEGGILLKKREKNKLGVKTPNLRWIKEVEEENLNVVAIVDVSGSMKGTLLIKSVNTALRNLLFYGNVYVMTFSGRVISIEKYDYKKGIIADWGGTDIKEAIIKGMEEKKKLEKLYGVGFKTVLITDLEDSGSGFEEVINEINVIVTNNKRWGEKGGNIIIVEEKQW